jgi:putative resolvase
MTGRRPGLARLLRDRGKVKVTAIVVEHADRLARLGVERLEVAFAPDRSVGSWWSGGPGSPAIWSVTWPGVLRRMCARLYGRRGGATGGAGGHRDHA